MGGDTRIQRMGERPPPSIECLEADEGCWRLSLDGHRDLVFEITGVDLDSELSLRDLETIRARLEGYVEREKRAAERAAPSADGRRASADRISIRRFERLVRRLLEIVPLVETTVESRGSLERKTETRSSYSIETVQQLARVFRAAADARRREISAANAGSTVQAAAD